MRRFFIDPESWTDTEILLPEETARHLGMVLRMRAGDRFIALNGEGTGASCCLEEIGKKKGRARIENQWQEKESQLPVRLLQGIPKGDKFDLILQKTTELGVSEVVPVTTERVLGKIDPSKAAKRQKRWERIAQEAARQCCRPCIPKLQEPLSLKVALSQEMSPLRLMLWEEASLPIHEVLPDIAPESVAVLVGPEGGLSPEEARLCKEHNFVPVGFGPRILRTETAGMAVCAILQYVYGDLGPMGDVSPLDGKEQS